MSKAWIGIDPGFDGALCFLVDNPVTRSASVSVIDMPTLVISGKKNRREIDIPALVRILSPYAGAECVAGLELVHSMPQQGVSSSFTFGKGFGILMGVLGALKIPYQLITPQAWKKMLMDGMGKDKDASRMRAAQLIPQSAEYITRKKDDGRADSILLAEYLRRSGA